MTKKKQSKQKKKTKLGQGLLKGLKEATVAIAGGFTTETCKSCGESWYRYRGPGDDGKYKDCWNCVTKE